MIPTVRGDRTRRGASKFIRVNGTDFAYDEAGDGPSLVFVHGSLGSLADFQAQVPFFASSYRVIIYSRRFHPPNEIDPSDHTYAAERHSDDLAELLGALGAGKAHLVGSSYGAYVILELALRRPELARSLVLGEPPILPLLHGSPVGRVLQEEFLRNTIEPARRAFGIDDIDEGVRTFMDGVTGRRGSFDTLTPRAQRRLLASGSALKREFRTESAAYMPQLLPEALSRLSVSTLLLDAERSPKMFKLITDELELALPDTERLIVPGSGHSMHTGNPSFYNDTVLRFLQRH